MELAGVCCSRVMPNDGAASLANNLTTLHNVFKVFVHLDRPVVTHHIANKAPLLSAITRSRSLPPPSQRSTTALQIYDSKATDADFCDSHALYTTNEPHTSQQTVTSFTMGAASSVILVLITILCESPITSQGAHHVRRAETDPFAFSQWRITFANAPCSLSRQCPLLASS